MHFSQATVALVAAAGFVSAAPALDKRAGVTDGSYFLFPKTHNYPPHIKPSL